MSLFNVLVALVYFVYLNLSFRMRCLCTNKRRQNLVAPSSHLWAVQVLVSQGRAQRKTLVLTMDIRMESMKVASLRGDIAFNPPTALEICIFQILRSPFTFFNLLMLIRCLRGVLGASLYFVCSHDGWRMRCVKFYEEITGVGGRCPEGRKERRRKGVYQVCYHYQLILRPADS